MAKNKQASIQQLEATNKVYQLRQTTKNDDKLVKLLDLSKVTLYTRLKKSNWKKSEIFYIDHLLKNVET